MIIKINFLFERPFSPCAFWFVDFLYEKRQYCAFLSVLVVVGGHVPVFDLWYFAALVTAAALVVLGHLSYQQTGMVNVVVIGATVFSTVQVSLWYYQSHGHSFIE